MEYDFVLADRKYKISVEFQDDHYEISFDDKKFRVDSVSVVENCISLLINGRSYTVYLARDNDVLHVAVKGEQFHIQEISGEKGDENKFRRDKGLRGQKGAVTPPMPGKIVKILVSEGQEVEFDQGLVIVEAMKMENEIRAPIKGRIKQINFAEGDLVGTEDAIVELEPIEESVSA